MLVIILLLICGALHTIVSFARWVTYLVTQKQHLKNRYRRTEVRLYKCGLCGLNGLCVYMYVGYTRIIYIIPYTVGALVRHFLLYTLSHSFPHSPLLSLLFSSSSFPHPPRRCCGGDQKMWKRCSGRRPTRQHRPLHPSKKEAAWGLGSEDVDD